jgi:hypothetical protein
MNCLDCATEGQDSAAVAVCTMCGGAVCHSHARVEKHVLTRTALGGMVNLQVPVDPPTRTVRCQRCDTAYAAVHRHERNATR